MRLNDKVSLVASGELSMSMTHFSDCNVYLVDCGQESVLIDAGTGLAGDDVIKNIDKELVNPLTHILVTHHHADHIGGLEALRKYYHAKVIVPEEEEESIREGDEVKNGLQVARAAGYYPSDYRIRGCETDLAVQSGDRLWISEEEILVYDGAGHSLGGVCYYFPKHKMIFVGDLVMAGGYINLQNIPGADIGKYARSVIALAELEVEQFYSGHGCFSLNGGKKHIDKAAGAFKSLGIPANFI